jgi:hypothetical protein
MVVLTRSRRVGKNNISQQLLFECEGGQYLNFDVPAHRALNRFAEQWPQAQAIQLVRECKAEVDQGSIGIRDAAHWLAGLAV